MKKRELQRSRQSFHQPVNRDELRAKVQKDLEPIKDTYDIAYQAIQQIQALIASIPSEERPVRAMRELAAALRDAAGVMVAMRSEGRDTVSYSANSANTTKAGTAEAGGPALPPPYNTLAPTESQSLAATTQPPSYKAIETAAPKELSASKADDPPIPDSTVPMGGVIQSA